MAGGITDTDGDVLEINPDGSINVVGVVGAPVGVEITDGVETAEVNARTDGHLALEVNDDCTSFEAIHQTLVASTDTPVTFAQFVRIVRVVNWDTANRVLIKDGVIASNSDGTATRVGKAPTADVPGTRTLPFKTISLHLRSAATSEVTVEGYF